MKKLGLLVMPLMAISFLASCNKGLGSPKPLEECSWEKISQVSKANKASKWFKIGDTKTIKVNGVDHKVRIIGFDQDVDKNNNKIGITFDFANLISDENGYSLATQWNDIVDNQQGSNDYLNSSIRKALTKKGNGHILWAQKSATEWSNKDGSPYKDKSVLEMLPEDLVNVLVAPKKEVLCKVDNSWVSKEIKDETGEYDKLILLSINEMNCDNTTGLHYTYYLEPDLDKRQLLRIKKETNGAKVYIKDFQIPSSSGQTYPGDVTNCAGWNAEEDETGGGEAWTRSPFFELKQHDYYLNYLTPVGNFSNRATCSIAEGVAPAFCI